MLHGAAWHCEERMIDRIDDEQAFMPDIFFATRVQASSSQGCKGAKLIAPCTQGTTKSVATADEQPLLSSSVCQQYCNFFASQHNILS